MLLSLFIHLFEPIFSFFILLFLCLFFPGIHPFFYSIIFRCSFSVSFFFCCTEDKLSLQGKKEFLFFFGQHKKHCIILLFRSGMRRAANSVWVTAPAALAVSRRHARRRQLQRETDDADTVTRDCSPNWRESKKECAPDVSSLRSEGMMAPPTTTSLDKIRSQLALMRSENMAKASKEKSVLEQQRWLESQKTKEAREAPSEGVKLLRAKSQGDDLTKLIHQEYVQMNKPNDVFKDGKEVLNGVAQRSLLLQQKRFHDADEVLRRSGKEEDTNRFVKLAFASSSEQTAQLVDLLQRLRAQWSCEMNKLSSSANSSPESTNNTDVLSRLAWMQVLEQLPEKEVCFLWEAEILDAETLISLFAEPSVEQNEGEQKVSEEDVRLSTQSPPAASLLDEKIDYVRRLHYLQELTSLIRETELGSVPSIDLAPTLVKVQRRQFADITENELRRLEQYGEAAAMRLSVSERESQAPLQADVSQPSSVPPHSSGRPPIQIDVPTSILDRALTPSNTFLSAVAERDPALKKSLEGMERIKREALLDPEFQEAVRFAHAVEEASIAPHMYGLPSGSSSSTAQAGEQNLQSGEVSARRGGQRVMSKRERRAARSRQLRGPMARSRYSPEVVPYFYNDMRSIVPPRGAFNLPDPAPTKAERAEQRGRRRRAYQRSRFRE